MNFRNLLFAFISLCLVAGSAAHAQDAIDVNLVNQIYEIRAIDNHTHAEPVDDSRPGRWHTDNPLGASRYPDVVALSRSNPDWSTPWLGLYGYIHNDTTLPHLQELLEKKRHALAYFGDDWPASVLERARVDIALVNTVKMGRGLANDHFRWVPYADPLLYPFLGDQSALGYVGGDLTINMLLHDAQLERLPATLAEYRSAVIDATLARYRQGGAVAIKILSAYRRGLDFENVTQRVADEAYRRGRAGIKLTATQQKALEDYLFRQVAISAGLRQLVVHIHTGNGDGPYFNNHRADPGLLEDAVNSPELRATKFVLLHGGWPYYLTAQAMIDKPNTYADFSAQTFYLTSHELAGVLRSWLSWHPEKVLFGSDAYSDSDSPLTDWEEKQVLLSQRARWALGLALTAMINDREISRERALEIARMVLRENALKLYGLEPH